MDRGSLRNGKGDQDKVQPGHTKGLPPASPLKIQVPIARSTFTTSASPQLPRLIHHVGTRNISRLVCMTSKCNPPLNSSISLARFAQPSAAPSWFQCLPPFAAISLFLSLPLSRDTPQPRTPPSFLYPPLESGPHALDLLPGLRGGDEEVQSKERYPPLNCRPLVGLVEVSVCVPGVV